MDLLQGILDTVKALVRLYAELYFVQPSSSNCYKMYKQRSGYEIVFGDHKV